MRIIKRPLHPDFLERGYREIPFNGEVYLVVDDIIEDEVDNYILKALYDMQDTTELENHLNDAIAFDFEGTRVLRLMDAANVVLKTLKIPVLEFINRTVDSIKSINNLEADLSLKSLSFEDAKDAGAQIIHWIPKDDNETVEVVMPDASVLNGLAEPSCRNLKVNDIVQFERFGFVRLDEIDDDKLIFYFAHK